jgi:hypothetical protein
MSTGGAGNAPDGREFSLSMGEGARSMTLRVSFSGSDISAVVSGGSCPHIGAVAFAVPHPGISDPQLCSSTTSVINAPGHRDGEIAERIAGALSKELGCSVCVACGIHVDDAGADDIEYFRELSQLLLEKAVKLSKEYAQ